MFFVFLVVFAFGGLAVTVWAWDDKDNIPLSVVACAVSMVSGAALLLVNYPWPAVDEACIAFTIAVLSIVGFIDIRLRARVTNEMRSSLNDHPTWM